MKKLKHHLRNARIALGKCFLDRTTQGSDGLFPPKKILFLRHDGKIGDYIVSSFVFREIKKQAPNTKIGVVCSRKNAYLFEKNPYIDQLYFVRTKKIGDYLKCGKQLAQEQYDVLIDPTVTLRNRDLLFLRTIRAKNYVGYEKSNYKLFNLNVRDQQQHFSAIYQQALELIGFQDIDTRYEVPSDSSSEANVEHYLAENKLSNFIALNLFGAGSARRFSMEKAHALLTYLTQQSRKPIVLLTFPEVTTELTQLAQQFENVYVYQQTKTVFDTIALIRHADLLISPDTSTVHIAVGLNKKLIAFYSADQQNFIHWQPNNRNETHIIRFQHNINEVAVTQIQPEWLA